MLSIDEAIAGCKNYCGFDFEELEQLAEWLEDLKAIKEMDLDIPQHFTKEQSDWIKAYCIRRNIEFYNKAIDDIKEKLMKNGFIYTQHALDVFNELSEQLKAGGENE